jgi:hypothetical protein
MRKGNKPSLWLCWTCWYDRALFELPENNSYTKQNCYRVNEMNPEMNESEQRCE